MNEHTNHLTLKRARKHGFRSKMKKLRVDKNFWLEEEQEEENR